ncbi:hypothetical protein ACPWT1_08150 [Ramlibacter sp. MMS24-I3-19]|uniref:hypothetical protein n=1 Tax=Ramlibacter sp. MMS24-I3-19 TaxID=3416606 RepID=UPI003D0171E8
MLRFDLRWHFGNVFYLLVIVRRIGHVRGMDDQQIRRMLDDIKRGRCYEDLLDKVEQWLPDTFEFSGDPRKGKSRLDYSDLDESVPVELQDLLNPDVFVAEMNAMNAAGLLEFGSAPA